MRLSLQGRRIDCPCVIRLASRFWLVNRFMALDVCMPASLDFAIIRAPGAAIPSPDSSDVRLLIATTLERAEQNAI